MRHMGQNSGIFTGFEVYEPEKRDSQWWWNLWDWEAEYLSGVNCMIMKIGIVMNDEIYEGEIWYNLWRPMR